jgi:hypothetical protein
MMPTMRLKAVAQQLIEINREAFTETEFNLAYHTLCAAMSCAFALNDTEALADIQRIAEDQQTRIDSQHPDYEHSSVSAAKRNVPGIFHTLALETKAKILVIKSRPYQKT